MQRIAEGFVQIANANMAQAIRSISLAKGYDPRDFALVAFGAAGPQHACAIATELGIGRILLHPDAGVLSALGIGLADVVKHRTAGVYQLLLATRNELPTVLARLTSKAEEDLRLDGVVASAARRVHSLDLRYFGTDATLTIVEPPDGDYHTAFVAEHRRLYGYIQERRELEVVAARVKLTVPSAVSLPRSKLVSRQPATIEATLPLWSGGRIQRASVIRRDRLVPGSLVHGPALVLEPLTTTVVDLDWMGEVLSGGELLLTPSE